MGPNDLFGVGMSIIAPFSFLIAFVLGLSLLFRFLIEIERREQKKWEERELLAYRLWFYVEGWKYE